MTSDREKKFERNNIEKVLMENFINLMPSFYEMQSAFLSGIYKRYGDLEGGNIVIFFARDLHLEILRKREEDLTFDLSLDNFWNNHKNISQSKNKVVQLNCQHIYHRDCISSWYFEGATSCPVCRTEIENWVEELE